jgi:hypothetical protein
LSSPLVDAVLAYLAPADRRTGIHDLASAIQARAQGGDAALARALLEQLTQRLRR